IFADDGCTTRPVEVPHGCADVPKFVTQREGCAAAVRPVLGPIAKPAQLWRRVGVECRKTTASGATVRSVGAPIDPASLVAAKEETVVRGAGIGVRHVVAEDGT